MDITNNYRIYKPNQTNIAISPTMISARSHPFDLVYQRLLLGPSLDYQVKWVNILRIGQPIDWGPLSSEKPSHPYCYCWLYDEKKKISWIVNYISIERLFTWICQGGPTKKAPVRIPNPNVILQLYPIDCQIVPNTVYPTYHHSLWLFMISHPREPTRRINTAPVLTSPTLDLLDGVPGGVLAVTTSWIFSQAHLVCKWIITMLYRWYIEDVNGIVIH